MRSGIYAIFNRNDGRRYVGSAVRLGARWKLHVNALTRGDHRNRFLQRAWIQDGEQAFEFRVLLVCAPENLLMYEQLCIDRLQPEYNLCKIAGSRLGTKYSSESRERLSRLRKAQPRSAKQLEHLANLAAEARGKPGRIPSTEERKKISDALKGRVLSPEHREAIRRAVPRGWTHTPAARAKIAAAQIERHRSRRKRIG